jgi:hypothetical protein
MNITNGICTGTIYCSGFTATCGSVAPTALPAGFRQNGTNQIIGTFSGHPKTFDKTGILVTTTQMSLIARYRVTQKAGKDRVVVVTGFKQTAR